MKMITRAKGGSKERQVLVAKIRIPDVWRIVHAADNVINEHDRKQLLECWALANDLLRAVREQ